MKKCSIQWLLKKIPLAYKLSRVFVHLRKQMPLSDHQDYEQYWQQRKKEGLDSAGRPRFDEVIKFINDGERVLDFGCGNGLLLKYLKEFKPKCNTLGCDISPTAIGLLRSQDLNGFIFDPTKSLCSQIGGDFDCVVLMEVLEHVYNAEDIIQQIRDLNPNRILITIPNIGYIAHRVRLAFAGKMPLTEVLYHIREHIRFWTVTDFLHWSNTMGFEVSQVYGFRGDLTKTLAVWWPNLFASGVLYELKPKQTGMKH